MKRARLLGLILFGTLVGFTPIFVGAQSAGNAPAANMCIAPDVGARLAQCPANAPRPSKGGHSVPNSHLSTSKRRTEEKKQAPQGPAYEIDQSTARNRQATQLRAEDLLRREIELTARVAQRTPASNPQRPDILLRLAEDYFELQQVYTARVRGADQGIYEACERDHNQARCRELRQQQTAAEGQVTTARENAIRAYAQLVQDHPNFRRMDEVLFSLGYALEEMRQFDRARQVYYRLIKGFPQSRFIPNAYLSFAEYFFGQSQMSEALQFYQKVTEIPAARNPVYGYAVYKQAWVQYNLQDFRASLQQFVDTIEFATANPEATDARNLARQARRELVLPYAQVGSPSRALEFFRRYAENEQGALDMFEQLGELYYDTGAWQNTISVYHDLMGAAPTGDKVCYWQSRVTNAVISSRPKREQTIELQRMVDLYEAFTHAQGRSQDAINSCKQATASVLVELATAWHREAVGTDSQPGTHDRNTMHEAEVLYQLLIEKFPDMGNMQFPDIDRRDWPTLYKIRYYYAELLWNQDKWRECGPAFDSVVDTDPAGEYTADAAMAAVLCYDKLYQEEYQPQERERRSETRNNRRGRRGEPEPPADPNAEFRRRDFTPQENGMANAFHRFICYAGDSEELPKVKYHLARLHYLSNQYEEAAVLFKDIAWNHRDDELAEYAANLYLDSLNVLLEHAEPPRVSCGDTMATDVDALLGFYCDASHRSQHEEFCDDITGIKCQIMRKTIEAAAAAHDYHGAINRSRQVLQQCRGDSATSARLDEVVYNMAIYYEALHLVGKAIRARQRLIETFPTSRLARKSRYLLGQNFHALAYYEQAAHYYEEFAENDHELTGEGDQCTDAERTANTCPNAPEGLQNAVFFRIGLGQTAEAIEDARNFERYYKRSRGQETAQVMFAIGSVYESQRDWARVVSHYRDWLRDYGRAREALPSQVIRANVQIAAAYRAQNDAAHAAPFYRDAITAWERGALERINALPEAQQAAQLLEAKTAVSEALFYTAEALYNEYLRIRFPEFRASGGANMEAVNRWATRDFQPWVVRKGAALREAEAAYARIAALEPVATKVPQWLIAAAARTGQMYTAFVDAFDDAPIPSEIERDPELYEVYVNALNAQRQIFFDQAIPKFEYCLVTSTQVRWFNEHSRTCELELNRLNPQQYPLAAELHGEASYAFHDQARPGAAELGAQAEQAEAGDTDAAAGAPAAAPAAGGGR